MTFDLFIERDNTFTKDELDSALEDFPDKKLMPSGEYRLTHRNVPHTVVSLNTTEGRQTLKLSVSWTHYRFIYAWSNSFDLALAIADRLNARVIEESNHSEITKDNIDELLNPEDGYVQHHAKLWSQFQRELNGEGHAYLEFPFNGNVDKVGHYCLFTVSPKKMGTMKDLEKEFGWSISLAPNSQVNAIILDADTGAPYTKIFLSPDGIVRIHPYYFDKPFATLSKHSMDTAESVASLFGGKIQFFEDDFEGDYKAELQEKMKMLGVEFYEWLRFTRKS